MAKELSFRDKFNFITSHKDVITSSSTIHICVCMYIYIYIKCRTEQTNYIKKKKPHRIAMKQKGEIHNCWGC